MKELWDGFVLQINFSSTPAHISWLPPSLDMLRINFDSLVCNNYAATGVMLNDYFERILCAFGKKFILVSVSFIEFTAV